MNKQKRIRAYGIAVGDFRSGKYNKITDVPGVTVGHATLKEHGAYTGVTAILPAQDNLFARKMTAACHVLNGFGKTAGLMQVQELGTLETPILLTNTLNVGKVSDALVEYMLRQCRQDGTELYSVNPIVAECNDSRINNIHLRAVEQEHVFAALQSASEDFAEGDVGGGTGMVCFGLKGGIGSASRVVSIGEKSYTLGVLVQSNFGTLKSLHIAGKPMGSEIAAAIAAEQPPERGSIIAVLATDAPLSDRQLGRVIRRMPVGFARLGSYIGHGSGEVLLGFSTAGRFAKEETQPELSMTVLQEELLDILFQAAADAAEEAVLNSMVTANAAVARSGEIIHSLKEFL